VALVGFPPTHFGKEPLKSYSCATAYQDAFAVFAFCKKAEKEIFEQKNNQG
jgi:hypothetical protein